ncbi:MAG: hypothetical protein M0D57_10435 [Sphingobacteriales bacterium JAD_PAG50586_3]|nr:MAG: hypothetical protein M0D57_10435 [Sphingobacteriales bacterium JAD_PAG50586_3]
MKIEIHVGNVLKTDVFTKEDVNLDQAFEAIRYTSRKGTFYIYEMRKYSTNNIVEFYPRVIGTFPYSSKEEAEEIKVNSLRPEQFSLNKNICKDLAKRICANLHLGYLLKDYHLIEFEGYNVIIIDTIQLSCGNGTLENLRIEVAKIVIENTCSDSLDQLATYYRSCITQDEKRGLIKDFKADTLQQINDNMNFVQENIDNPIITKGNELVLEAQQIVLKTIEQLYPNELDIVISEPSNLSHPLVTKQFNKNTKLKWHGNTNALVDIFYQMAFELKRDCVPLLQAEPKDLIRLIQDNFTDKYGDTISETTIRTIITPSRVDKRPKGAKKLNLQEFFSEEDWDDDIFVIVK